MQLIQQHSAWRCNVIKALHRKWVKKCKDNRLVSCLLTFYTFFQLRIFFSWKIEQFFSITVTAFLSSTIGSLSHRQTHITHIIVGITCVWPGTHLVTLDIILICIRKFKMLLSIFRIYVFLYLGIPWISDTSFVLFMLLFIAKNSLQKTGFQNLSIKCNSIKMVNFFRCYF